MSEIYSAHGTTITVRANGQPRNVREGSTVADLLREVNVIPTHVVVQMDGVLVERSEFENVVLKEGNKLEIVTIVGGG